MAAVRITAKEQAQLEKIVAVYRQQLEVYTHLCNGLRGLFERKRLSSLYHSIRWRVKDPNHLLDKLQRKLKEAKEKGELFDITPENFSERITDLVGIRILHLHTNQFDSINQALQSLLAEEKYRLLEGPIAKAWDPEYEEYFKGLGIMTEHNKRFYTSVHYVVDGSNTVYTRIAEIQVRTLAEELWGEVDHTINYPHESEKLSCREQIRALARVTNSSIRLVDSIFRTHNEPDQVVPPGGTTSVKRSTPKKKTSESSKRSRKKR